MAGILPGARTPARVLRAVLAVGVLISTMGVTSPPPSDGAAGPSVEQLTVPVEAGPTDPDEQTVDLDASLYLPATTPAPAILLAHGFGGSKKDLTPQAKKLQQDGYVVLTYSARGFGRSTGRVALDSLDAEVPDARSLVSLLAERPEVLQRDGDPVVGVAGASYGGALALMLGATDPRIDAVVAIATWNDLAQALVPNSVVSDPSARQVTPAELTTRQPGVLKIGWASRLFAAAADPRGGACGRFTTELCATYTDLVLGRTPTLEELQLLERSSPASVLSRMTAPTLLLQGTEDSLFGLDQADANARAIDAAGAPVQVGWFAGGHDGGIQSLSSDAITQRTEQWFADHLGRPGSSDATAGPTASASPAAGGDVGGDSASSTAAADRTFLYPSPARNGSTESAGYPGLTGAPKLHLATEQLQGGGVVVNPPGGVPAAVTSIAGLGTLTESLGALGGTTGSGADSSGGSGAESGGGGDSSLGASLSPAANGQSVDLVSPVLENPVETVGGARVTVRVSRESTGTAQAASGDAILYLSLLDASSSGLDATGDGVAPIRIRDLPADGSAVDVTVALPATAYRFPAGDRVVVRVSTTDALYQNATDAAAYAVRPVGGVTLPVAPQEIAAPGSGANPWLIAAIGGVLALAVALIVGAVIVSRRRRAADVADAAAAGATVAGSTVGAAGAKGARAMTARDRARDAPRPLVVEHLGKRYPNGLAAVDDLSFTVERGQVLGLLGPNGAGKTTTLRMAVGLLIPDSGSVRLFGETVRPGAPALARVGCFIEGPGFLPHLSGRQNLETYWAASGRASDEARFDEVLAIADLGDAVERRVRGYSQGMRQRLAIAQAMLGMPELLILDEPTNGLDPPQIFEMRGMLRRYAESGRTVIVSSHLLNEIEVACTHVVVMSEGRLLAAGSVTELAGRSDELTFDVSEADAALAAFEPLKPRSVVAVSPTRVRVDPGAATPDALVAALVHAGVGLQGFLRGRHLEETFLELVGAAGGRDGARADGVVADRDGRERATRRGEPDSAADGRRAR